MAVPAETYQSRGEMGMRFPIGGGGGREVFSAIAYEIKPGTDLAIVTVNTDLEDNLFAYNARAFRKVGFPGDIRHVHKDLEPEQAQELLRDNIGGIYLSGGDQGKGLPVMQQLQIDSLILDLNRQGVVVAGTSAGCSELGEVSPFDQISLPGLNIIEQIIADQHFERKGRRKRLESLKEEKKLVGVGLESGAALRIDPNGQAEFIGEGEVLILTPSNGISHEPHVLGAHNRRFDLGAWVAQTVFEAHNHAQIQAA